MTKLPEIQQRDIPQAISTNTALPSIIVEDRNAVPKALGKLGETISSVALTYGQAYEAMESQKNKFNYSIAKSKFLQDAVNINTNLEQDPDYDNMPKKYQEAMRDTKVNILKTYQLPENYRKTLEAEMNIYEAQQFGNVVKETVNKRTDANLALSQRDREMNLETASRTKNLDTIDSLRIATLNLYANAIPLTDQNRQQKIFKIEEDINKDFAYTALQTLSYEKQLEILRQENKKYGSNITQYFTPSERKELLEKTENQIKQSEREREVNANKDQKTRERKLEDVLAEQLANGVAFNDLPVSFQLKATKLDQDKYNKLYRKVNNNSELDSEQQEKNFQMYEDLYTNSPNEFANISKAELIAGVSADKRQIVSGWQERVRLGSQPDVVLKQRNSIKTETLRSVGIKESSKDGVMFKTTFDNEVKSFIEENKRQPNSKESQEIASGLLVQATFDRSFLPGTNTKRLYEVDKKDLKDIIVPDNDFQEIRMEIIKAIGKEPSSDQIKRIYLKSLGK